MSSLHGAVDVDNVRMGFDPPPLPGGGVPRVASADNVASSSVTPLSRSGAPTNPSSPGCTYPISEELSMPSSNIAAAFYDSSSNLQNPQFLASPLSAQSSGQSPPLSGHSVHPSVPSSIGGTPFSTPGATAAYATPGASTSYTIPALHSPPNALSPPAGHSSPVSSPLAGPMVTSKGVTLASGSVVPTRDGSQMTVGAVVVSMLDNVVQMASRARDAYVAGKGEQTHAQIEELLESLKLVGGLGAGPNITSVHSNMATDKEDGVPTSMASAIDQMMTPFSPSSLPLVTANGSGSPPGPSPGSSVSPPQRMAPPLPHATFQSIDGLGLPLPGTLLPAIGPVTRPLGPLLSMETGTSNLPTAQPPTAPSFDPTRKRATSSAPSGPENARGAAKFTKLTPPLDDVDEAVTGPSSGHKPSDPGVSSAQGPMDSMMAAPPLVHAHTYPGPASSISVPIPGGTAALPLGQGYGMQAMPPFPSSMMHPIHGMSTLNSSALNSGPSANSFPPWPMEIGPSAMTGVIIPPPHASPIRGYAPEGPNPHNPYLAADAMLAESLSSTPRGTSSMDLSSVGQVMNMGTMQDAIMNGLSSGIAGGLPPILADVPLQSNAMMGIETILPHRTTSQPPLTNYVKAESPSPPLVDPFGSQIPFSEMGVSRSRPTTSHGRALSQDLVKSELQNNSSPEASDDEFDDGDSEDGDDDGFHGGSEGVNGRVTGVRRSGQGPHRSRRKAAHSEIAHSAQLLSPELKEAVDRIFLEYLNRTCSNLDATDSKGEAIHQTLMAKKMARLDESPDFRPFKFRIQAFTNGFVEELARQGLGEDQIPIKKTKAYLWHQNPYIARFNEDGKKAKSKGNHIWNIEAKKMSGLGADETHRWTFKKFARKIAGSPPSMAYIGLKWQWEPKIWDPQLSRASIDVEFSSPNMPPWMHWDKAVLSGVPTADSQSIELVVQAKFVQDAEERLLSISHSITVAPLAVGDSSYPKARRPSLIANDANATRRFVSDSIVPQSAPTRLPYAAHPVLPPPGPSAAETAQVIAVINSAANRVAVEAQNQATHAPGPAQAQTQAALARQQQVLTVAAHVISNEAHNALVGLQVGEQPKAASVLVQATQSVVHQAARQLQADKTAVAILQSKQKPSPMPPLATTPISLADVSIATQSAVAHAVAITGSQSSEVEVMLTANSLIQQRSRADSRASLSGLPVVGAIQPPIPSSTPPPFQGPQPQYGQSMTAQPSYRI